MSREERILEAEMARACRSGDLELVDNVLSRSQRGRENLYLMTGFYNAIMGKQIDIMKYLAEQGAFIDRGGNGQQGFLAINTTSIELLDTLYDLGWRPNVVSIIYAVHHTHDDNILRWLLEHGADPTGYGAGLALQGVVVANRFEAVDMLLEHGVKINSMPLHMAAQRPECFEMMKYLVSKGADVNSSSGLPLTWACSTANGKAATWLMEQGAVMSSKKFGKEMYMAEARLHLARELDASEPSDELNCQDSQGI